MSYIVKSSIDATVVSIKRLKSNSFKLALAVNRSRNVSKGDNLSADGNAAIPEMAMIPIKTVTAKYNAFSINRFHTLHIHCELQICSITYFNHINL